MHPEIAAYHAALPAPDRAVAELLAAELTKGLPNAVAKVWHAHPVWFLGENPIAGYSKLKGGIRLLFWSGQSFDEPGLRNEGTFKAAEARYASVADVDVKALRGWLKKAAVIQWDYGNLIKRRGVLVRLDLPPGPDARFVKVPASRRAGAKKAVAKKPVAKKPVAKKPVAKKPVAKKPVAKKKTAKRPLP